MSLIKTSRNNINFLVYILLAFITTYFIGNRGGNIGSDTETYFKYFNFVKDGSYFENADRIEAGFYWITKIISLFTNSENVYLSIIFFIQFIGITSAFYKKSKIFQSYLLFSLIWLSYPFFYSITLNVIRQGLAFVFVIYAIDRRLQNEKYFPYILLLLGVSIHYATLLYFICFVFLEMKPKVVILLQLWIMVVCLAFLGGIDLTFNFLLKLIFTGLPYYSGYLDSSINKEYVVGFKINFLIFSTLPIIYFFLLSYYKAISYEYLFIFKLYLMVNILYFCFIGFPYNDRIALASWLLFPLMMNFCFLKNMKILRAFKQIIIFLSAIVFSYHLVL